jgi:hypothetical protein
METYEKGNVVVEWLALCIVFKWSQIRFFFLSSCGFPWSLQANVWKIIARVDIENVWTIIIPVLIVTYEIKFFIEKM